MEQDLDAWTRQMTNLDEVTDIQDAIREGDDLIWIWAKFTPAQQVAEEQNKGKDKKTLEQMVPEDFIGFRFVFEKEASEWLPERKPWNHAIDLQEGALPQNCKVYPLTQTEQEELNKFLKEHLAKDTSDYRNHPWHHHSFLSRRKMEHWDQSRITDTWTASQ